LGRKRPAWRQIVLVDLEHARGRHDLDRRPDTPVRVAASTEGGAFEFSVANSGDPIPETAIDKLFEPFFRGDVRASRQGLGLGLHIASQIAQAHGGRISLTSTPAETRFVFTMPLRE
jgi:sigma-B regulation protein RsbU (phosphoserine phosphatase)